MKIFRVANQLFHRPYLTLHNPKVGYFFALFKAITATTSTEKFNKELLERLDRQKKYIDQRLNERDKNLMNVLNELQEQRKLE